MSEQKQEVRTFLVSYICDVCNDGEMKPTGVALMSSPPQYPHTCSNCGALGTFRSKYPKYVSEVINGRT